MNNLSAFSGAAFLLSAATSTCSAQVFPSSAGNIAVETVAKGLNFPWALAFLPDGRFLVTERVGRMRIVASTGSFSAPIANVPQVFVDSKAGLLDVALDRNYAQNSFIYFCYAEPAIGGARTALARARLSADAMPRLDELKIIFREEGPVSHNNLFGCRIVQTADDNLFLTLGESVADQAQDLANHLGKIVRLRPDGSVPPDNPFVGRQDAKPEIWSYGHRNAQGLALNPANGKLWEHEHGPRGGDEVNVIEKGKNYGWPVIGYGIDYSGAKIHESSHKPGMEQPIRYWVPSIAPSGMAFYTGNVFPLWHSSLFIGALAGQILVRLELDSEKVVEEEHLLHALSERIRDVRQGPDGALWLLTDNSAGRILRLVPAQHSWQR
jgi:aldose sugar dehydrogenase